MSKKNLKMTKKTISRFTFCIKLAPQYTKSFTFFNEIFQHQRIEIDCYADFFKLKKIVAIF